MKRVQWVVPDVDHARFARQAEREGMSLGAWLHQAALGRLTSGPASGRPMSAGDLEAFFARCDALEGPDIEPEWEDHLATIRKSRGRGRPST